MYLARLGQIRGQCRGMSSISLSVLLQLDGVRSAITITCSLIISSLTCFFFSRVIVWWITIWSSEKGEDAEDGCSGNNEETEDNDDEEEVDKSVDVKSKALFLFVHLNESFLVEFVSGK
ncbi:hypothetical protein BDF20DRAFT_839768 [Mycotypha africana]|uniref:uncharacterized protein n=1 Tax=Mycotypha africana TaxID=64632 RepID=UPI00230124FB|nr:uncharacterized protein BDF20DRAFT_839768 [Mycotypha africana]KAI8967933.1 hypothetical protein BDF20DRAFT_839768 [Mycotypha africana]